MQNLYGKSLEYAIYITLKEKIKNENIKLEIDYEIKWNKLAESKKEDFLKCSSIVLNWLNDKINDVEAFKTILGILIDIGSKSLEFKTVIILELSIKGKLTKFLMNE